MVIPVGAHSPSSFTARKEERQVQKSATLPVRFVPMLREAKEK